MKKPDRKIEIMGIVNLTDDSYYAPSRCGGSDAVSVALERIRTLIAEGADIIDLGACSTRPGALPVGPEEEYRRLKPVLEAMVREYPSQKVSIDTYHSAVVEKSYDLLAGALGSTSARDLLIVNDISAGEDDPCMLPLVGSLGLKYIAMHKRGDPVTMQSLCCYEDVVAEVRSYFEGFSVRARENRIEDWVLDPGFGFAKTVDQNYQLLAGLDSLAGPDRKVLVGVSRKSMVYRKFAITPEEALPATQVLHMKALQLGADILRVHDVAEAVRTVELYRLLR